MKERPILFSAPMVRAILDGRKTVTRRMVKGIELARGEARGVRVAPNTFCYLDFDGVPGLSWRPFGGSPTVPYPPEKVEAACPYGGPGDRLWVRETWAPCEASMRRGSFQYRADGAVGHRWSTNGGEEGWSRNGHTLGLAPNDALGVWVGPPSRWRPSIHMPRWASRITLEVTGVRVERLQAITEADAVAEGVERAAGGWRNYDATFRRESFPDPVVSYRSLWESINGPDSWRAEPWVWVVSFRAPAPHDGSNAVPDASADE